MNADVLIVGSGAAGVNAAYPLVEAGYRVMMLDVGNEDETYAGSVPNADFTDLRHSDPAQHRYFLGERFEGVPVGAMGVGPQLTPPRQFILRDTASLTPVDSKGFLAMSSLALGGLASGWGAGAFQYSETDLQNFPISRADLAPHYARVAARIGVSGTNDDLLPFEGELPGMLPPLAIDRNAETILARYQKRRARLNASGVFIGKPRLAALSQPFRGRGPDSYHDMSFWSDADQSVWRPKYTLHELLQFPNFHYQRPVLVQSFQESEGMVSVLGKHPQTGAETRYQGKRLILAASTLGTTRIVLRSLHQHGVRVPLLCNPYTYYPMLNLNMLGQTPSAHTHSLAQLCVVYQPQQVGLHPLHGRVHSYRSLLNFKVIKMMPLAYREAIKIMQLLAPNLAILALDQADHPSPRKYCQLHPGVDARPDRLETVYDLEETLKQQQLAGERTVLRGFRALGCIPMKRVWPGYGISLHYGGTLPMQRDPQALTVNTQGLLHGSQGVYIADGAVFPYLPPKGMTFTIMAMANRVGEYLCEEMKSA